VNGEVNEHDHVVHEPEPVDGAGFFDAAPVR
jgi:hypothetical protein